MSELSKRMRESRAKASQGEWYEFQEDDDMFMGASGVYCDSPADRLHDADAPDHGDINPNIAVCLTCLQSPRAACHRDGRWDANTAFIVDAANSIDDLCNEVESLERENAALRAELETLRAKIDKATANTERIYGQGFRAGMTAAMEALNRAKLEIEPPPYQEPTSIEDLRGLWVDPSHSDSALLRAMAEDPEAYPPQKS